MISDLLKLYVHLSSIDEMVDYTNLDFLGLTDATRENLVRAVQEARGELMDNLKKNPKTQLWIELDLR